MSDTVSPIRLRVLVLSPNAVSAPAMVRCARMLGHAAESCAEVAAAEALVRTGAWDALVVDLDALAGGAPAALRALAAAPPAGRPCMLLGAAFDAEPFDTQAWAVAGLDRLVSPICDAADWRLALDPALPSGFDPQPLARLRELDAGVSRDSARALLDESPRKLETIRAGAEGGDAAAARRAAHSLKGGASQLGVLRLAGLCARIEEQFARGDHEAAAATCDQLEASWRAAAPWLAREAAR
jgi:HPt (histidine-containing phosphotransfer) domain-containing protein